MSSHPKERGPSRRVRRALALSLTVVLTALWFSSSPLTKMVWLRNTPLCEFEHATKVGWETEVDAKLYRFRPTGAPFLVLFWEGRVLFSVRSRPGFYHGPRSFNVEDGRIFEIVHDDPERAPLIREKRP